jgi:AhpD family alkylhydroperoxidase
MENLMARVAPAVPRRLDLTRRLTFACARLIYGRTLEPTRIIAHHRPLMLGYGAVALAGDRFSRSVPARLKELAMLRAAQLVGCEWCLDFGSKLARDSGVPEEDLRALSGWRQSDRFDPLDRTVLEYAEAMTRTPVEVPDELFTRVQDALDARQIVELTLAIGLENLYSRTNWAFGIEGQGFSDGMYCVLPEARTQSEPDTAFAAGPPPR